MTASVYSGTVEKRLRSEYERKVYPRSMISWCNERQAQLVGDSVILAVGMQSTADTVKSMLNCAIDVVSVGDCIQPGTVREASRTAYYAALDI